MHQCTAIKANGDRCKIAVPTSGGLCWAHSPENNAKRSRTASKAAKSKPNREVKDIKALLAELTDQVLTGKLQPGRAAIANQLINTRLRAIEQERKIKETEEILERIERLENRQLNPSKRWG